jgi:hypothetical protein
MSWLLDESAVLASARMSDPSRNERDVGSDRGAIILIAHLLVIVAAIIYFTNR